MKITGFSLTNLRVKIQSLFSLFLLLLTITSLSAEEEVLFRINKLVNWRTYYWGFMDKNGRVVISPQFEALGTFHDGAAWAKQNGKWGIINRKGKFTLSPQFDDVREFEGNTAWVIGECKAWVIYDCERGKWGLVDTKGNILIQPVYDGVDSYESKYIRRIFDKPNGALYLDRTHFAKDGYARVYIQKGNLFNPNRIYGVVNKEGKVLVEPDYYKIGLFQNGTASYAKNTGKGIQFGLLNTEGRVIVEPLYRSLDPVTENGAAEPLWKAELYDMKERRILYEILNSDGKVLFDRRLHQIKGYYGEYAWARETNTSKWGLLNKSGDWKISPAYKRVALFANNLALASLTDTEHEFIDAAGTKVDTFSEFNRIYDFDGRYGFFEGKDYKPDKNKNSRLWGLVDGEGRVLQEAKFDRYYPYNNGYARIYLRYKVGLLGSSGNLIHSDDKDFSHEEGESFLWFTTKEKDPFDGMERELWGFADEKGTIIKHCKSFERGYFADGVSWITLRMRKKGNEHILYQALIDEKGNELTQPLYLYTLPFENGLGTAQVFGGSWGYINTKGKIVWWIK